MSYSKKKRDLKFDIFVKIDILRHYVDIIDFVPENLIRETLISIVDKISDIYDINYEIKKKIKEIKK